MSALDQQVFHRPGRLQVPEHPPGTPTSMAAAPQQCAAASLPIHQAGAMGFYCGWCQPNHPLAKDGTTSTGMCPDCLEKMRALYATPRRIK